MYRQTTNERFETMEEMIGSLEEKNKYISELEERLKEMAVFEHQAGNYRKQIALLEEKIVIYEGNYLGKSSKNTYDAVFR